MLLASMYLKMPPLFFLSVFFIFILLFGTSFANLEACGVTHVTVSEPIITELTHHPTEATNLHVEPINTLVTQINGNGDSAGHCAVHGVAHSCGHTSDFGHYPNSTTAPMLSMTGIASSASTSETSFLGVSSHLTTFATHQVSATTNVGHATSSTSSSSTASVIKSVLASIPIETTASANSPTSLRSETSATTEPSVSALSGYPYGGSYPDKVLYTHNVHRANHSAPNLGWDQRLADAAHAWAVTCQFRHNT